MDATVSARIPVAVKERGNAILKEIGATPSQLINAAYDYLLANHELPKSDGAPATRKAHRVLTKAQIEEIDQILDAMYLGPLPEGKAYEQLREEAWEDRYARFA